MSKAFDVRHPFFRPLWRRVLVTALCVTWALVELASGNPFWAMLFGGCAAYIGYHFFIAFKESDYLDKGEGEDP